MLEGKLTLENLHDNIKKWKQPYLEEVSQAAPQFKHKVHEFQEKLNKESESEDQSQYMMKPLPNPSSLVKALYDIAQKSKRMPTEKKMNKGQLKLREWKSSEVFKFKDYDDLMKNYQNIFQNKQKNYKKKEETFQDFRADERLMLEQIFQEIREPDQQFATFDSIIGFFNNCDLFYLFYNIQSYRLKDMLKQFCHKDQTKLSKSQFLNFFLIDRIIISELICENQNSNTVKCILPDEAWRSLKQIFDTLDTFGNENIYIRTLFQKIKSSPSSVSLFSFHAVQYPSIERRYTLEKIFFDLENKVKFDNKVSWTAIQNLIKNFRHIDQPTVDQIYSKNIRSGKIQRDSNYFMLEEEAIQILKQIFQRCPKFCKNFVKTTFFSFELLESSSLQPYLTSAIRGGKNGYTSLQFVIKRLSKEVPQYIDLDEMLEYFSIKGLTQSKLFGSLNFQYDEISSSDAEQSSEMKQARRLQKIKSLKALKKSKKRDDKNKKIFQRTKVHEFNLKKKTQPTIRQKKVKEMIAEVQQKDDIELNKKFKANPIPVSLNPERYQKYAKMMQKRKQLILNQLNMKKESDALTIQYLKSNTKLFEERKIKNHCTQDKKPYSFEPKPLTPNILQQMLPKIEDQKRQRRNHILKETQKKYAVAWRDVTMKDQMKQKIDEEDSLLQKINEIEERKKFEQIKANPVPNFEELHRRFQQQLENRKNKTQLTRIKQFHLSSPSKRLSQYYSPQHKNKSPIRSNSPPKFLPVQIRSTKKYDDWIAYNQTKAAEKEIQILEKEKQNQERLMKQKNFAKFMRKSLTGCTDNSKQLSLQTKEKVKNYKRYVKELEKSTEEELAQIYVRVLQRPFLFEEAGETVKPQQKIEMPKKIISGQFRGEKQEYPSKQLPIQIFDSNQKQQHEQQYHEVESDQLNNSY